MGNNKVQNKDVSDRIMFHKQHRHVIFTISKIFWTNDWTVKALVTMFQANFIHCSLIVVAEASQVNDETA